MLAIRLAAILKVELRLGCEDLVSLSPANPVDGILFAKLGDLLPTLFIYESILGIELPVVNVLLDLHPLALDLTNKEGFHAEAILHERDLLCGIRLRAGIEVDVKGLVLRT